VVALGAVAASGHAGSADPRVPSILNDWLHLVSGALWLGGIGLLVLLWWPVVRFTRAGSRVAIAREVLEPWRERIDLIHGDYRNVDEELDSRGVASIDGALADLGVSSMQLEAAERGFSFMQEGPLDMRMDQGSGRTAADIVNGLDEADLADMIYRWGEERYSRRIARAIVSARRREALTSTRQLTSVIESAVPGHYRRSRIHCATRTFQALRITVNQELDHLETSLRDAADALAPGARLCVISFHSLEDRIVKQTFKALSSEGRDELEILTKRPQVPSESETDRNPRSRSAKLRVLQRIVKEGRA